MTILLILSICLNIYLFILHKQQATALDSLRGLDGINQGIISKLKRENKAESLRPVKPVVKNQPVLFG